MKIAINGFGRIGRAFFRAVYSQQLTADSTSSVEVVAINDLGERENLEYLLRYDSVYRQADSEQLTVYIDAFKRLQFLQEKEPHKLPWKELGVDVVVESTGFFTTAEKAEAHLTAGAKRVVISAPSENAATVLMGINDDVLKTCHISSNASCTTNAASPIIGILNEGIGIEKALLNTVHGYTATQKLVDGPSAKDPRKGRAAAINIIPTSTGAAAATTKAHTQLAGKFDGIALRVPVPAGSIADITFIAKKDTSVEEVNYVLEKAAANKRWKDVFTVTTEPLVSSDILGNSHASIADLSMTRVVGGNLVKVLAWYDNEVGYANALLAHVRASGLQLTANS